MNQAMQDWDAVARLVAESEIRQLLATYIHRLDAGDFEGVAAVLEHAEMDVLGTVVSGREGVKTFMESGLRVFPDGTPRTWHTVANELIAIDPAGDRATSSSYYTVHQQLDGFPLQPICTGKYLDRFERHEGKWRFSRRSLTLQLVGDLQHHVKGPNETGVARSA